MYYDVNVFEPKEWSMLHAVMSRTQAYLTSTNLQSQIINLLSDMTLRRRQLSIETSLSGLFKLQHDEDSIALCRYCHGYMRNTLYLMCDLGIVVREPISRHLSILTLNVNAILTCYIKLKSLSGVDMTKYINLLNKASQIFPNDIELFIMNKEEVMKIKTIEDAIEEGLEKKRERIKKKTVKKNESATELYNNIVSIVKSHGFAMPPLTGAKNFSMLKRFLKDCAALDLNVYDTVDYLCVNMPQLIDYIENKSEGTLIVTLYRDFFDFEKIYFNKGVILNWVRLTKQFGFDLEGMDDYIVEQKQKKVIKLSSKRGKRGSK